MSTLYLSVFLIVFIGKAFTPKLAAAYKEINKTKKVFEVAFVSSDKSAKEWAEYYGTMPWISIPFGDARIPALKKKFNVTGIPTLVILAPDGKVLCEDAYDDVDSLGGGAFAKWVK